MRYPAVEKAFNESLREFLLRYPYGELPLPEDTKRLEGWIKEFGVMEFDWTKLSLLGSWALDPPPRIEAYDLEQYRRKYPEIPGIGLVPGMYDLPTDTISILASLDVTDMGEGFIHEYGHAILCRLFGSELYTHILDCSYRKAFSYMEEPVTWWGEQRGKDFTPLLSSCLEKESVE